MDWTQPITSLQIVDMCAKYRLCIIYLFVQSVAEASSYSVQERSLSFDPMQFCDEPSDVGLERMVHVHSLGEQHIYQVCQQKVSGL